jgi:Ca-activated chloride channel family protein
VALTLIVIAMAGPRWPDYGSRISTEGVAIQILLDVSGSMAEPDFAWDGTPISRLEAAKRSVRLFVAGGPAPDGVLFGGRPHDLIGLVTFATWPETVCPLTLSRSVFLRLLDDEKVVSPKKIPGESHTNIGDAMAWGLRPLNETAVAQKVMVLISDGEQNVTPPALTPRQAAQLAANLGVRVYVVDVGGMKEPDAEIRAAGIRNLQAVAMITNGRYFTADNTAGLIEACNEIDKMERRSIESFVYRRYHEAAPWFGLAALAAWVLLVVLEATVLRRLP